MEGMVSGVLVAAAFAAVAVAAGVVAVWLYRLSRRVQPGQGPGAESPDA